MCLLQNTEVKCSCVSSVFDLPYHVGYIKSDCVNVTRFNHAEPMHAFEVCGRLVLCIKMEIIDMALVFISTQVVPCYGIEYLSNRILQQAITGFGNIEVKVLDWTYESQIHQAVTAGPLNKALTPSMAQLYKIRLGCMPEM